MNILFFIFLFLITTKFNLINTIPRTKINDLVISKEINELIEEEGNNKKELRTNNLFKNSSTNSFVVIRVIPLNDAHLKLLEQLEINGADMEIIINDVENLIIERERKNKNIKRRRLADEPINDNKREDKIEEINFHNYNSYSQMVAWMRALAKQNPKFIGSRGFRKRAFWIDGGIHAREWAAPHTALYFIHQLVSRYGKDEEITRLANEITWIIVPLLNPDGYEFTRSSTNPNIRLWRKNRSPTHCVRDQWGRNRCCKGKVVLVMILVLKYIKDSYPGDVQDLFSVGQRAASALSRLYGTKYVVGSGADTLYPASGGSEDWAKESANIKYVYLLELRPDEKNWDGFILDERQLMPTATETWAGVRVVAEAIIQRARARRVATIINNNNGSGGNISVGGWVKQSEHLCQSVAIFMADQCARSCGFC
uniref:Peptidase M14 carboxypeptidase A domain-containing protein n=1 Tax=Meloidogyne floridensis TaxID=298350 RepID=A0A915PAH0_9BILA